MWKERDWNRAERREGEGPKSKDGKAHERERDRDRGKGRWTETPQRGPSYRQGLFLKPGTRPERHGVDRGIRLARCCPPRAPSTWLQARGSLHQLRAAPTPPPPLSALALSPHL